MEINSLDELNKLCRLCLSSSSTMFSIYTKSNTSEQNLKLSEMITECTSIHLQFEDYLPKSVCLECLNTLEICYKFKQRCKMFDAQLHESIKTIRKKEIIDVKVEVFDIQDVNDDTIQNHEDQQTDNLSSDDTDILERKESIVNILATSRSEMKKSFRNSQKKLNDSSTKVINSENNNLTECVFLKNKGKYVCPYCSISFKVKYSLLRHKDVCENRTHFCNQCQKSFNSISELQRHLSEEHQEVNIKSFVCDICEKEYTNRNQLLLHYQSHLSIAKYFNSYAKDGWQCYICVEEFKRCDDLWTHTLTHQTEKTAQHACEACKISFATNETLRVHNIKKHGFRRFTCNRCLVSYSFGEEMKNHIDVHAKEKLKTSFNCEMCQKSFTQKSELKMHFKEHSKDLFKCLVCSKSCTSLREITTHYHNKHYAEVNIKNATNQGGVKPTCSEKTRICPVCGKLRKVSYLGTCYSHFNQEKPLEKQVCTICQKTFTTKLNLKMHKRIHDNYKPYVCTFSDCDYRTTNSTSLKTHIRFHTGDRPYKCEFPGCDKRFLTSGQRLSHIRRHTDDRREQCEFCPARFGAKSTLKKHRQVHLNIYTHPCDLCDKKFRRLYCLKEHKQKMHS